MLDASRDATMRSLPPQASLPPYLISFQTFYTTVVSSNR